MKNKLTSQNSLNVNYASRDILVIVKYKVPSYFSASCINFWAQFPRQMSHLCSNIFSNSMKNITKVRVDFVTDYNVLPLLT